MNTMTWEELIKVPVGEILYDEIMDDVRIVVRRNRFSLCGYYGLPVVHPLTGTDYMAMPDIDVHCGLTYDGYLEGVKDWYFWGWDYGHYMDKTLSDVLPQVEEEAREWLVKDVVSDAIDNLGNFKRIANLKLDWSG